VEGEVYRKRKTAPNLGEELAVEGVGACAEKPQPVGATLWWREKPAGRKATVDWKRRARG
jgi:hypothetical protein